MDLELIDIALAHGGPITLAELAEKSKADPDLLRKFETLSQSSLKHQDESITILERILRILISINIFAEESAGVYTTTPFSPVFASPSPIKSAVIHIAHMYQSVTAMPDYFAKNGYQNPKDAMDAPFQLGIDDANGETYFSLMAKPGNERLSKAFNDTMEMQKSKAEAKFAPGYPATERLKIDDAERVLLVDVGGNVGHQLTRFQESYPDLPGKLVLIDLPSVVETATSLPDSITKIGHDFFTPQPELVKNAKAFYMRMILHDWPEKQAHTILSNIVDVMADDSVVLIHEVVLPETGVAHFEAKMDWHMMNMGALERTEKQWNSLAASVGLEVKGIWWDEVALGRSGVIELGKKA